MRRFLPLLAALGALAGCSSREHLNPLDPENPVTGGAPAGFTAVAGDGSVRLTWVTTRNASIVGYRVSRRLATETSFAPIADLDANAESFFDFGLANDVQSDYRLQFVLADGALGRAAEDAATPGATRPWVADYAGRALIRLAPDGRRVAERIDAGFQAPYDLDVDPGTGRVWVCDPSSGRVLVVAPGAGNPVEIGGLTHPVAVAVDRDTHVGWICDDQLGWLLGYDPAAPATPVAEVHNLGMPVAVAVDPVDGTVWECERSANRVGHVSATGTVLGGATVILPSRVAVDSVTRNVWVTSFTRHQVTELTAPGVAVDSIVGLGGPIGIAVDSRAGRIWVADTGADRVIVYDRSRTELFRVTGLTQAREIGVDPIRGQAWVTLPPAGQVALIGPGGALVRRLSGLVQPYDVAVDSRP